MTAKTQHLEWSDLQLFGAFVEAGDVGKASRQLQIDQTTLSRRLKRLEAALGARLVEVRERKLVLTAAGREVARSLPSMIAAASHVSRVAARQSQEAKGLVRITAIRSILGGIIVPGLARFRATYPQIDLELLGDTRNLSLARREADVAIRLALPTSRKLITRKLGVMASAVYGSASRDAEEWLGYGESFAHVPEAQWLEQARNNTRMALRANAMDVLIASAKAGLGKTVLPCFLGDREPGLRRLSKTPIVTRDVWLAVHEDDRENLAVRAVMDLVLTQFHQSRKELAGR
jgi:DNA-binding transcriptional LysR family regulator